jgi:hypothetical protein
VTRKKITIKISRENINFKNLSKKKIGVSEQRHGQTYLNMSFSVFGVVLANYLET